MPHTLHRFVPYSRFGTLPEALYTRLSATPVRAPRLLAWNAPLAAHLGFEPDPAAQPHLAEILAGNRLPESASPLASVYSGHQFGSYVPQLGDGRALLIGEHATPDGEILELQLKGAGPTPYSRGADGRSVLRSAIREYLASEALHGLGIPTTRALGLVGSDDMVLREAPEPLAVLLRVAPSFVRFGHFEFCYWSGDHATLRQLADWVIEHFYPACRDDPAPYAALLREVSERTAALIARWQAVGFCHGVMNSDNMSILGLTLDYGPFGFMNGFNAQHICNHSDTLGRYAYHRQPEISLWNLYCLAQALTPLCEQDALNDVLKDYQAVFEARYGEQMQAKLGLKTWMESDWELLGRLLVLLQQSGTDWTIFWRALSQLDTAASRLRDMFIDREAFDAWTQDYLARLELDGTPREDRVARMNTCNPVYVLRNHLAETAIRKAQDEQDTSEIERLRRCLSEPFREQAEFADYALPPPDWASEISVSCSS
ncbi:Uncharacterized conserved protein YdiU, UPF0061 family [Formivibrio citricus]|uniref:Protein nucleotidyltransferase YdiU n=2 Tax=Formivibrio citricus TaxID=83765 RepID=A0A1I4WD22_9NEIS|nr:YdiU family protein [Formivibrio citricus]SFN11232.1 Uncharacterized conserved protein YdiU, UPF0061 family [Formivibrio citricus]